MKLRSDQIRRLFRYFSKDILDREIDILRWIRSWSLDQNDISRKFLNKVKGYKWLFRLCPHIREIYVCNTVALWCANKDSDIDLFVVCSRLWTSRIILTLILHICWLRRHWNKIAWRLCLSFWVTERWAELSSIQISNNKDPYLAIWTVTLIPILNTWYHSTFISKNKWVEDYWLSFVNTDQSASIIESQTWYCLIEGFLKRLFISRTINKASKLNDKSGTIITDDVLKFHDNDIRQSLAKTIFDD